MTRIENGDPQLSSTTTAFALSAAITVLFSTALAWVKDAYHPLNSFMNSLTGHNWTTHGLVDVTLFFGLGLLFSKTKFGRGISSRKLISFLVEAVVVAGIGLFAWYALY